MTDQPAGDSLEWHDSSEVAPSGTPLWLLLDAMSEFARIEMGTYGTTGGWRSAFNREIEFRADVVDAWAVVHYPLPPERRWVASSGRGTQPGEEPVS